MTKKIIEIKDIGTVLFYKNKKAAAIKIILKPDKPIRVTVPERTSFKDAERFLVSKKLWIKENFEKINKLQPSKTVFDETTEFKTHYHSLSIKKHNNNSCKYIIKDNLLEFYYPFTHDVRHISVQQSIYLSIIETLRLEAKNYLPQRVKELSEKYNLKYRKIFIKNLKSRWGSCSSNNNINFNLHIMRLPKLLADYVILHELAHIKEKNHGKSFWDLLDSFMPNAKFMNKELKKYSVNL